MEAVGSLSPGRLLYEWNSAMWFSPRQCHFDYLVCLPRIFSLKIDIFFPGPSPFSWSKDSDSGLFSIAEGKWWRLGAALKNEEAKRVD